MTGAREVEELTAWDNRKFECVFCKGSQDQEFEENYIFLKLEGRYACICRDCFTYIASEFDEAKFRPLRRAVDRLERALGNGFDAGNQFKKEIEQTLALAREQGDGRKSFWRSRHAGIHNSLVRICDALASDLGELKYNNLKPVYEVPE